MIEGRVEVHTECYDPVVIGAGESIYLDSNMGHAYIAAAGCEEATVLGACSSADEGLMESLLELHGDEIATGEGTRDKKLPEFPRARSIGGVDDSPISHGSDTEWFHTYLRLFIDDGTVKVVPNEDHTITVPLMTDLNGTVRPCFPRKWRIAGWCASSYQLLAF
ncbi:MAG TPA: cupin domain-containing protein, partial [Woeseiaceae bacterium]